MWKRNKLPKFCSAKILWSFFNDKKFCRKRIFWRRWKRQWYCSILNSSLVNIYFVNISYNYLLGKKKAFEFFCYLQYLSFFRQKYFLIWINPLSSNPTEWSNVLKTIRQQWSTDCLSVFDYFIKSMLKGSPLKSFLMFFFFFFFFRRLTVIILQANSQRAETPEKVIICDIKTNEQVNKMCNI